MTAMSAWGSATSSACAPTRSPRWSQHARPTARSDPSTTSPPARARAGRRSSSWRGRVPATASRWPTGPCIPARHGAWRCGGWAWRAPRHAPGGGRGWRPPPSRRRGPPQRLGGGTQLALPLELPAAPALRALDRWAAMLADYATTTVSTGDHPMGLLREELRGRGAVSSADLEQLPHGSAVRIGGLVVGREGPGAAGGGGLLPPPGGARAGHP